MMVMVMVMVLYQPKKGQAGYIDGRSLVRCPGAAGLARACLLHYSNATAEPQLQGREVPKRERPVPGVLGHGIPYLVHCLPT